MKALLIHPKTKAQVASYLAKPTHALMLSGSVGIGKNRLARFLASELLKVEEDRLDEYPYFKQIQPVDEKTIGIDSVRELEYFNSLTVPIKSAFNRVILIRDGHYLSHEAQNALLKVLEEPPHRTAIIVTTSDSQALLPTIRSRTQRINMLIPSESDVRKYFSAAGYGDALINKAFSISAGLPELMQSILEENNHPLTAATEVARQILGQSFYERLLMVDSLSKQKPLAIDITNILQQMAHLSLQSATGKISQRWQRILSASYRANEELAQSVQPKLVLTKLMLSL